MLLLLAAQAQAAAYWRMYNRMNGADDAGACAIFNALSEADKIAVARLRSTEGNCLLSHAQPFGCVEVMKLVASKGATKELVHPDVDCYTFLIDYFVSESPNNRTSKATEALALLVVLGMPIASAWTDWSTKKNPKRNWQKSDSELTRVLDELLSALNDQGY